MKDMLHLLANYVLIAYLNYLKGSTKKKRITLLEDIMYVNDNMININMIIIICASFIYGCYSIPTSIIVYDQS